MTCQRRSIHGLKSVPLPPSWKQEPKSLRLLLPVRACPSRSSQLFPKLPSYNRLGFLRQHKNPTAEMHRQHTPPFIHPKAKCPPILTLTKTSWPVGRTVPSGDFSGKSHHIKPRSNQLPPHLLGHVTSIKDQCRDSPEPSEGDMAEYRYEVEALENGCVKGDVRKLMERWVLPSKSHPSIKGSRLECTVGLALSDRLTPSYPGPRLPSTIKLTQPKPGFVYGYSAPGSRNTPFSDPRTWPSMT